MNLEQYNPISRNKHIFLFNNLFYWQTYAHILEFRIPSKEILINVIINTIFC